MKMDVAGLAAPDCVLFMWATWPKIEDALPLMAAWGFQYKTVFLVWVKTYKNGKPKLSVGRYTRSNSEVLLVATRGKVLGTILDKNKMKTFSQIFQDGEMEAPITAPVLCTVIERHSKKPDVVRRLIESFTPDAERVELFSRDKRPGWHVWGDMSESTTQTQISSFMEKKS